MLVSLITAQIEEIEADAEDQLLQAFGSASIVPLPVNINTVAARLGLAIKQGPFTDPNVSGYFDRNARTIYVASDEPPARQAFTVAHEIGHDLRHKNMPTDTYYRNQELTPGDNKPNEQEANWFASALLMPRRMVEAYWPSTRNVETMADIFGVSAKAMQFRLRNLGLI